ncbi:uncharacterized protein Z520_03736 [Fonsecaea multimorphosa CBS 102226]|uniref:DNA endonuclease activator Ctp1 C-terminal domain-containing protein n=1 Tax=Fonsecaea multimorphosa CBS 102226 TaxID=1442371 RepID=A0A0D2KD00_9EURO|nr:uncharacterized protein Z520_03736 [Fonsecaea multimorphosa CBS 102226]KIY01070.1 hypothetical protein Z520_03736 [Fonsecaea multimorphosa CBS 102226]OAL21327.1 hypothetical protein AYO22_08050 [Fonsecaea multimorphosa]
MASQLMDAAIIVDDDSMENHNPHVSPNPLKCPPAPLHQLSPERMNQQRLPQSPSLHSYLVEHDRPRTRDSFTSDVQSKVAFLNSLAASTSVQSSPTRPRRLGPGLPDNCSATSNHNLNTNNALQRAVMGYEEAQASLASLNAELERAKEEVASKKKRERMLSQRVEELLEELQAEKEKRGRDQESYTKEIKRCRKETYRAELAVVEARQDLQEVRAELKKCQAEIQHERTEKEKSRQESFERAYALAGMVGEMDQLKDRLKAVEKERDAALLEAKANAVEKNALLEKGVQTELREPRNEGERTETPEIPGERKTFQQGENNRSAQHSDSESDIQSVSRPRMVPASMNYAKPEGTARLAPKLPDFATAISRLDYYDKQLAGEKITPEEEVEFLKQELAWARKKHEEDSDLIHFMHMQCQFKACPCRLAESNGDRFVHDQVYDARMLQQRASKKRKISNEVDEKSSHLEETYKTSAEQSLTTKDEPVQNAPKSRPSIEESEPAILPPDPTPELMDEASEGPLVLEQAVGVPLPEPDAMELDSSTNTPEVTAQLEEITQVLVEPARGSQPFSFSTSITTNAGIGITAPLLRHTESTSAVHDHDLFDLSPPKQAPPRRPSTALGILTVDSPVRLVPDSPRSVRSSQRESVRRLTKERHHAITPSVTTTTTKIALKDSPSRASLHRRAQSKPNLRSHSPLVASVMSHHDDADEQSTFVKDSSASPGASTVFPVTPLHKHSRSMHNLALHAQTQAHVESQAQAQVPSHARSPQLVAATTTTRVPLREAVDADDDMFSLEQHRSSRNTGHDHAQTEVLNIRLDSSITSNREPISHLQTQQSRVTVTSLADNSGTMLSNVPGTPISREAALAQIRARRDRARSVNLKRSALEGHGHGHNGNKGVGVNNGTRGSPTKPPRPAVLNIGSGGGGLFQAVGKENARREISQASAPGRLAF